MSLHWLPVRYRMISRILLVVYKVMYGLAPKCICDMLSYKQSNDYSLRSDERSLIHVPTIRGRSVREMDHFYDYLYQCYDK